MHGIALKLALPLVSLAGIAAGSFATQTVPAPSADQLERYRTQMANMAPNAQPMTAQNPLGPADPAIAVSIAQWTAIRQTDALPFDSYAGFLLAHPGWPGEATTRRVAERKAGTAAPGPVVAFFRRYPPQTAGAGVAFAQALVAQGVTAEANAAARAAWRKGVLSPTEEGVVLSRFAAALTPDDHDQRMDALLWAGSTSVAARQIGYVSPARRQAFATRLAFRSNDPQAAGMAVNDDPSLMGDAGYLADRATWLRTNNAEASARALLARPRTLIVRPGNVEKWYEVNLALARGAAADRQWQLAYDIARQLDDAYAPGTVIADRPYGERDDYTSLAWLGGQAALKGLGRPADAAVLFDRYGKGSNAPQTRSKGLFWAGRAFARAGQPAQASSLYGSAAAYRDQFYGQLAAEASGRPLTPPPPIDTTPVDPVTAQAFARRETVRAAQLLGNVGQWQDQSLFLRQIATDAKTSADHKLANDLSRQLGRPDLAVMIGRSALVNGLSDYAAAGFPTVAVPAGYESNWTLIHAIARQESQFDRAAISSAGARGLMQLMPGTAREQAGKMGMVHDVAALTQDPQLSIRLGSSYFDRTYARFNSYPMAIAAYNAGGGNVNKWLGVNGDPRTGGVDMVDWIEAIPFSETRNYVQRVLENAVVYDLMNPGRAKSRGPRPMSWYLGQR